MYRNIKLTYDGFGLNDANDEYRKRVLTFADKNTPKEVGEFIKSAINNHEELLHALKFTRNVIDQACGQLSGYEAKRIYDMVSKAIKQTEVQ